MFLFQLNLAFQFWLSCFFSPILWPNSALRYTKPTHTDSGRKYTRVQKRRDLIFPVYEISHLIHPHSLRYCNQHGQKSSCMQSAYQEDKMAKWQFSAHFFPNKLARPQVKKTLLVLMSGQLNSLQNTKLLAHGKAEIDNFSSMDRNLTQERFQSPLSTDLK